MSKDVPFRGINVRLDHHDRPAVWKELPEVPRWDLHEQGEVGAVGAQGAPLIYDLTCPPASVMFTDQITDSVTSARPSINYRYSEDRLLADIRSYIDGTYAGHYSRNQFQATEFIIDCGHGTGFTLGNVMKYAQRYGKKQGFNRHDLLKIIHYAIIALHIHDKEHEPHHEDQ